MVNIWFSLRNKNIDELELFRRVCINTDVERVRTRFLALLCVVSLQHYCLSAEFAPELVTVLGPHYPEATLLEMHDAIAEYKDGAGFIDLTEIVDNQSFFRITVDK